MHPSRELDETVVHGPPRMDSDPGATYHFPSDRTGKSPCRQSSEGGGAMSIVTSMPADHSCPPTLRPSAAAEPTATLAGP